MNTTSSINPLALATQSLLSPYHLELRHLEQTLTDLQQSGAEYADLYFQYLRSESWGLEEGLVKKGNFSIEQGVGIRSITHGQSALAYTDDCRPAALQATSLKLQSMQRQGQSGRTALSEKTLPQLHYQPIDPSYNMRSDDKVALLKWVDSTTRSKSGEIIQVMTSIASQYEIILIANSDGELMADIRPLIRFTLSVIMERDGRLEMGFMGGGGRCGLEHFTQDRLQDWINQAVQQAQTNLVAKPTPAGEMTVVLGPGWPGVLLHEAVGHGLEGDFTRKEASVFSGKIGEKVAAKGITIIDNGTLPNRRGSLNIDDEGTPTKSTTLIEDGVVCGFMQDRLNADLSKVSRTGNGRRESFAHLPIPRMTNTYMLGGSHTHDEILASVDEGLYFPNFAGGQVDITNGNFVFSASEAWRIEKGRLLHPVKGATLIGNGQESLTRVSMIGNNLELDSGIGTCGKEGQSVPVGVGQPTLRLEKMTVGGTE